MKRIAPILALVTLLAAGCGSSRSGEPTTTAGGGTTAATAPKPPQPLSLRIYLLRDGKVAPVARAVPPTRAVGRAALEQLLQGPTRDETLSTALSPATTVDTLAIADGVADVKLTPAPSTAGAAQVVYTLTQFPSVRSVSIDGGPAQTRADFEDETPQILVESPLPDAAVTSPIRISGTADTFEATFQADVVDGNGKKLTSQTVTATSGSGQRGTFTASIPVDAPPGPVRLIVYEISAADASHLHQVEIPLTLARR